jgi:2-polyprenyl-3-methyl-5-hydroxy-6-metoxy-1,4-benzoquinol methylase
MIGLSEFTINSKNCVLDNVPINRSHCMINLPGNELYWDQSLSRVAQWYCRIFGVPIVGLRIRWRTLLKLLPGGATHILDAGCGRGVISRALARSYPAAVVDALDQNAEGQETNRHLAAAMGLRNCAFIVQDLTEFNAENEYDLIVSVDNLEHIQNDQAVLNKLFRAMKSEGMLLVHVPHYYRRWPTLKWRVNFNVPGHVRPGYHQAEIVERVRRAGFVIEKTGFSYGFLENLVNNVGYAVTEAKEKHRFIYALLFPVLNVVAWLGQSIDPDLGAGVWVVAYKPAFC